MYAVIETGGKQYRVAQGDVIRIELLEAEAGSDVEFDRVLMVGKDDASAGVGRALRDGRQGHRQGEGQRPPRQTCSPSSCAAARTTAAAPATASISPKSRSPGSSRLSS